MKTKTKQKIDFWIGLPLIFFTRPLAAFLNLINLRDRNFNSISNFVFLKFQGGGSLIIALPALLGIKSSYPKAKITLVTTSSVVPFAETLGIFDDILVIRDKSILTLLLSAARALAKTIKCDTLVDLEVYSFISIFFGFCTFARIRIGFYIDSTFWRRGFLTHLIFLNRYSGIYYFYEDIAMRLGGQPESHEKCAQHLRNKNDIPASPRAQSIPRPLRITIGHGCSDFAKERQLSIHQWILALKEKTVSPSEIIFLGGQDEVIFADRLIEAMSFLKKNNRINFRNECGRLSLKESITVLADSDIFMGVDSSLLHYARALKVPCISFWGPTDPTTRLKSIPSLQEEVNYRKIPCSPCVHVAEEPPCKGHNICISGLFPQESLDKSHKFNSFILDQDAKS